MVWIVAVYATDAVLQVGGPRKIAVFFPILVAVQAPRTNLGRRSILEGEDLGFVPAALDVRLGRFVRRFEDALANRP